MKKLSLLVSLIVVPSVFAAVERSAEDQATYERAVALIDGFRGDAEPLRFAREELAGLVDANFRDALAYVQLARCEYKLGMREDEPADPAAMSSARELLDHALSLEPNLYDAQVALGYVHLIQGDDHGAELSARRALQANPHGGEAFLLMANLASRELAHDDVVTHCQTALRVDKTRSVQIHAHQLLTAAHVARLDFRAAEDAHQALLKLDPRSAWARANYALFLLQLERHDEAIEQAKVAIANEAFPLGYRVLAHAYYAKGAHYHWRINSPDRAGKYFKLALAIDPGYADAWYGLAMHYRAKAARQRNADELMREAESCLQHALELEPDHARARDALGETGAQEATAP